MQTLLHKSTLLDAHECQKVLMHCHLKSKAMVAPKHGYSCRHPFPAPANTTRRAAQRSRQENKEQRGTVTFTLMTLPLHYVRSHTDGGRLSWKSIFILPSGHMLCLLSCSASWSYIAWFFSWLPFKPSNIIYEQLDGGFTFTFIHLVDTLNQSDFQERALPSA